MIFMFFIVYKKNKMECINRNIRLKQYSYTYLPKTLYSKKDKLDILKNGHDISNENLDIVFSNDDLNYTYSDISNFIISNNLHLNLNYDNLEDKNIIKNILWNVSKTSIFYNKNIYRSDPDGCLIKYNDFIEKDIISEFSKYPWTIVNIFHKTKL